MYIGVAQTNRAWLLFRNGEWVQAETQAEAAMTNLTVSPYPFHWLAQWLLLTLALRQNRLQDAIIATQAMLDIKQQQLPHEIDGMLATAVTAWDAGDETVALESLETAVTLATQYGYL